MDSLSQAVLGASVMAAVLPARQRRKGLAAGALLGTVPDLDTFIVPLFSQTPVDIFTWHRGPSHALWLLLLLGWLLWWLLRRRVPAVQQAPNAWLLGSVLALLTHPLLDAFTVYGTQLWWPSSSHPVMWSSLFIIDPLYTLPLLLGVVLAWIGGARRWAGRALLAGLVISTAYIGWSQLSRHWTDRIVATGLAEQGLADAPRLLVNTPLNTMLWRIIVMTPQGYAIGHRSIFDGDAPLQLQHHASEMPLVRQLAGDNPEIQRLLWFTSGFMAADITDGRLVLRDLRMGTEGSYFFSFAVARQQPIMHGQQAPWQSITPAQAVAGPRQMRQQVEQTWQRLWHPLP
ncbi:metal-dependent hydrolase [Corticibacter populi]|nr:metal-dependent hydrolase [Corticibacter populi]RZS35275.1 inner membrane protein [Corticibacter populi]